MKILFNFKAAFAALMLLFLANQSQASFSLINEDILNEKTSVKLKEMGDELFEKTGVSTVVVVKEHLDQKEFLEIKNGYLKELKKPYVLWIFSKRYMDREKIGLNQMFNSSDVEEKFDRDSLFSPWRGTFTKIISIHRSKVDPTGAAFLNGYGDLVDMLASSYGVKLDSSIGSETKFTIDIVRIVFYLSIAFFLLWYFRIKFFKK